MAIQEFKIDIPKDWRDTQRKLAAFAQARGFPAPRYQLRIEDAEAELESLYRIKCAIDSRRHPRLRRLVDDNEKIIRQALESRNISDGEMMQQWRAIGAGNYMKRKF